MPASSTTSAPLASGPPTRDSELARDVFLATSDQVMRVIAKADGGRIRTVVPRLVEDDDPASAYDGSWLRLRERPTAPADAPALRVADLFSGVGGLSVGAHEMARSLGLRARFVFAADTDDRLLACYANNLAPDMTNSDPIQELLDGELGKPPTRRERRLQDAIGPIDLMLAGPPCQGHSDLNNHTRRHDARNALYLRVARFAEVLEPRDLVIENVCGAVHDRSGVVQRTREHLEGLGYRVDAGIVRAEALGVPQKRRRFFILASHGRVPSIARAVDRGWRAARPVAWALHDLGEEGDTPFDTSAKHSVENRRRIAYLFDHGLFELPDSERPSCHRDKPHSYKAVYGRMRPAEPAPTITVGFGSTGQGRFVHPWRRRTLTPHEAARVQTFPDWFTFGELRRGELQKAIGNAVPPLMSASVMRDLIS
jgi:DNA (cytosine-5)-methyltransferase 1